MRATFEQPHERAIFATRLGLNPTVDDDTLAEAAADYFNGGGEWLDADHRPTGTPDDDFWDDDPLVRQETRSRNGKRTAAGARVRRGETAAHPGGPAPRPQGRVTFGGSGYSMIDR